MRTLFKFAAQAFTSRSNNSISVQIPLRWQSTNKSSGPLEGIRVLDMSRILAGPYCTMILGDFGAEIIKIEQPGLGDDTRQWGPPFIQGKNGIRESCYFLSVNRNKKSVAINFRDPKGLDLLKELAVKSDVLVENFVPGKLADYGMDYESLKSIAPHLIYCSISGFGTDGPYADRAGYDVIAASIGGLLHITGPQDGEPCKVGVAMTDLATGLYAQGAIMAALLQRRSCPDGLGQKIDCDLLSTQVATLVNLASNYLNGGGQDAKRYGTAHASIVPYQSFKTLDGYYTIGCGNDVQFKDFCRRLNLPEDEKFGTNEKRVQHRDELTKIITDKMTTKSNKDWDKCLEGAKFPYGPVNNLKQVFADPQVRHNQMIRDMTHSGIGKIKQVGPAVTFSASENGPRSPPPMLGEHTDDVLGEVLGLSDSILDELRRNKTIQ